MRKSLLSVACALLLTASLTSCHTLDHQIGTGAKGNSEESERQWYILFGLIPINEIDSQDMAGGATNYDVKSEVTFADILLSIVTGLVTIDCQTVTVTK